jgi:hypothetical protein
MSNISYFATHQFHTFEQKTQEDFRDFMDYSSAHSTIQENFYPVHIRFANDQEILRYIHLYATRDIKPRINEILSFIAAYFPHILRLICKNKQFKKHITFVDKIMDEAQSQNIGNLSKKQIKAITAKTFSKMGNHAKPLQSQFLRQAGPHVILTIPISKEASKRFTDAYDKTFERIGIMGPSPTPRKQLGQQLVKISLQLCVNEESKFRLYDGILNKKMTLCNYIGIQEMRRQWSFRPAAKSFDPFPDTIWNSPFILMQDIEHATSVNPTAQSECAYNTIVNILSMMYPYLLPLLTKVSDTRMHHTSTIVEWKMRVHVDRADYSRAVQYLHYQNPHCFAL